MSDITGPPAPKEVQQSVRSTDKAAQVAKDPNNTDARAQDRQQSDSGAEQSNTHRARDPAVSISATAAHLRVGQELHETVSSVDSEGRPVIVTETATFALRPDAGLQVDDAVTLKVTEAGKAITAELLARNSHVLNPPAKLTLIITEIHIPQSSQLPDTATQINTSTSQPYRAPLITPVRTETLIPSHAVPRPETGTQTPQPAQKLTTETIQAAPTPASVAKLLGAEQGTPATPASTLQQNDKPAPPLPATGAAPAVPQPIVGDGVGPAIAALSEHGAPTIIQVLDPSVSQVSPAELATVSKVSPLSAAHAVMLGTGSNLLTAFDNNVALSVVDTNRDTYIAPTAQVANLTGELVRLETGPIPTTSADAAATASINNTQAPRAAAFPALLISEEDGAYPQRVSATFIKPESSAPLANTVQTASIKTVHTQAAFLSPDGPKADIRLQTTAGELSLTIPSGQRPKIGDTVQIRWPETAPAAATLANTVPTEQPAATTSPIADTVLQSAAANTAGILTNWPAMQESIAAIAASGNPAVLSTIQDKTAQGGGKLANSLLFFLAAAGRAGPRAWIGQQAAQTLQTNAPALLSQLSSDIRQMANMASDRSGEWRAMMLPVDSRPGEVPLAALLVQQHPDIDPDEKGRTPQRDGKQGDEDKRFILQVQFSVLGDIQLDGHINRQQFDLIIRSATHFSPELQSDLKGLFDLSLNANGYAGALSFEEQYPFAIDAQDIIEEKLMH